VGDWKYADWTFADVLQRAAAAAPDLSVTFTDDRPYTTAELWDRARGVAGALRARGVEPGACVGIFVENRAEFLTAFFGAAIAGCVSAPLNTAQRGAVLEHMVRTCDVRVLIADAGAAPTLAPLLERAQTVTDVAIVRPSSVEACPSPTAAQHDFAEWEHGAPIDRPYPAAPGHLATLMLTSGTTGPSKAVMWSNSGGLMLATAASRYVGLDGDDVAYTCLPLFHGNALYCTVLPALIVGAHSVVGPRFSASTFWQEVADVGATKLSLLGTMHRILYGAPEGPFDRAHSVQRAVVAPAPVGYHDDFEARFGFELTQFYGLSDVNMIIGVPPELVTEARAHAGSCGVAGEHWELQVVDDDDRPVAAGDTGELVARPRIPFTGALGYLGMPDATIAAWRNLWYHTGDAFRRDADGWFYFVDRKKDAIRRAGENISSMEVENVLRGLPGVVEAAVYAVPSAQGEDDVMAALEVDHTWSGDFEALLMRCYGELAYFAIPRYIRIVDQMPRTESEKVRKDVLRGEGVTDDTWDRGPGGKKQLEARLGRPVSRASL
jgi:carnitine-CoA ligase